MLLFNFRATPSTQYQMAQSRTEVSKDIIEYVSVQLISFTMFFVQIGQNLGVLFLKMYSHNFFQRNSNERRTRTF